MDDKSDVYKDNWCMDTKMKIGGRMRENREGTKKRRMKRNEEDDIDTNGRKGEETEIRKSGMNEGETRTRMNGRKLATPPGKYSTAVKV